MAKLTFVAAMRILGIDPHMLVSVTRGRMRGQGQVRHLGMKEIR